jgi:hypothetical protein
MRDEIETTAGEVAAELARRGIGANRHVSLTVEPDDWLARGHQAIRPGVAEAGFSNSDIDRLIRQARREASEDMRHEASERSG